MKKKRPLSRTQEEEATRSTVSRAGEETRRGEILGVRFSPATPLVVAGVDVYRRSWDVQWQHLALKLWCAEIRRKRLPEKKEF
ncbi:hypothetical protein DEO72_LG2g3022 [Vigna unguiculata]|nr:hypothetical protein DEO72_LG2g3022 [Vigna unguiculata]